MVGAASGCCAMELNADDTDFPSPSAGIMQPMPVVIPAVTIDATPIIVILSIFLSSFYLVVTTFIFSDFPDPSTAPAIYTVARILKIYACTMPVSKPRAFITIGNINGVMLNRIATIIPPLMILPNNLTANASVREISLIRLNGNIMKVGFIYDLR
jgi:hypothetical protein